MAFFYRLDSYQAGVLNIATTAIGSESSLAEALSIREVSRSSTRQPCERDDRVDPTRGGVCLVMPHWIRHVAESAW
eukprot:3472235-Pyramimonas_sp.AAC.4